MDFNKEMMALTTCSRLRLMQPSLLYLFLKSLQCQAFCSCRPRFNNPQKILWSEMVRPVNSGKAPRAGTLGVGLNIPPRDRRDHPPTKRQPKRLLSLSLSLLLDRSREGHKSLWCFVKARHKVGFVIEIKGDALFCPQVRGNTYVFPCSYL